MREKGMKPPRAVQDILENPPDRQCTAHPLLTDYVLELQKTLREELTEIDKKIDEIMTHITRQKTIEENREKHGQLLNNLFLTIISGMLGFLSALIIKGF